VAMFEISVVPGRHGLLGRPYVDQAEGLSSVDIELRGFLNPPKELDGLRLGNEFDSAVQCCLRLVCVGLKLANKPAK
jgi:hypothetical protein